MSAERVAAVALVLRELGGTIIEIDDDFLGTYALAYGSGGQEIFPCVGKVPAIAKRDGGRGVLDATTDLDQIEAWWRRWPNANIGGRVPAGVAVVDVDPRNGGDRSWAELVQRHGDVITRTAMSGRGDGGAHRYLRHPGGPLRASIAPGIDVKTNKGYTMLPPSIHPDSGRPYTWVDPAAPIVAAPGWLAELMRKPVESPKPTARGPIVVVGGTYSGESVADWYSTTKTWHDVLTPHGWLLHSGDGESNGSRWRHPAASHPWSATVKHGCLFVYSPGTPFEVTEPESPRGYTKFRAHALLDHRGDLSAAAKKAFEQRAALELRVTH